jgi:transcriptional regulator with XRE-family HTH domain
MDILIWMNAMRRIRCEVFRITQQQMAAIAGVEQATVSRWETGVNEPSLRHLKRIRTEARRRKLQWDDDLLFAAAGRAA